jgi:hypothetical protein
MSNITEINGLSITAATASFVPASAISGSIASASYAATASLLLGSVTSASYAATASYSTTLGAVLSNDTNGKLSLVNSNNTGISIINNLTASLANTSSYLNTLNQNLSLTGSMVISGNLTVLGTASFTNITASQLFVSQSYISVNVFEPQQRFGGLYVYDSGSSNATASLSWDSLNNRWVYSNATGSTYTGGMLISGPRNTGSLGDEPSLTNGKIPRSIGGDHIGDSIISEITGSIGISGSTSITGSLIILNGGITGSLQGTASWAQSSSQAISSSYALTASYALNGGGGGITLIQAGTGINVTNGSGPTVTIAATSTGGTNLGLTYAVSIGYFMP